MQPAAKRPALTHDDSCEVAVDELPAGADNIALKQLAIAGVRAAHNLKPNQEQQCQLLHKQTGDCFRPCKEKVSGNAGSCVDDRTCKERKALRLCTFIVCDAD